MNYVEFSRELAERDAEIARLKAEIAELSAAPLMVVEPLRNPPDPCTYPQRSFTYDEWRALNALTVDRDKVDDYFASLNGYRYVIPAVDPPKGYPSVVDWAKAFGGMSKPPSPAAPPEPEKPVDPRSDALRRALSKDKPLDGWGR